MIRSDGIASDLMVEGGESFVKAHKGFVTIHTPNQPDYWFGNCIVVQDAALSPEMIVQRFEEQFPDAAHVCAQWDIPDFEIGDLRDWFTSRGYSEETGEFMALNGPIKRVDCPEGIEIRPVRDADWDRVTALQLETGAELRGEKSEAHRAYLENRNASRRDKIASGFGEWFGAFDGDLLVGDLGIFCDDRVARYQAVETRESHRGRGICSALLCEAHDWVKERSESARILIAADANDTPRFLYRKMGFTPFEVIPAFAKPGY